MSGYDAPIGDVSEDLLGRAEFANSIARLAAEAPSGWGVRIGVYGRWGEGKTSVLRLVERHLRSQGHLVAAFNPWGCTTSPEMVGVLADSLIAAASAEDRNVDGGTTRLAKRGAKVLARAGELVSGAVAGDTGKQLAKLVSPWLERWAGNRKSDIVKVLESLRAGERLIVLVDDVDRVDPKLLPQLFFALHEVFALPDVTFILALDPEVVGAALLEYHSGFKSGTEFLEKIVQFPRWLPVPTAEAIFKLAQRDRATFVPFIRSEVFTQKASLLPTNPRELRSLIRGLWCLGTEVERHDPDELDQHLLFMLESIRQMSPPFLTAFLGRDDLLSQVAFAKEEQSAKFESKVRQLAEGMTSQQTERIVLLAQSLCKSQVYWGPERVRYHAYIGDRPHAVTWKEYRSLLECVTSEARSNWVLKHAQRRSTSIGEVMAECLRSCVQDYRRSLEQAAGVRAATALQTWLVGAGRALDLLEWIWFQSEHAIATRSPSAFSSVIRTFSEWAHFTLNEEDRAQRVKEEELARRMAREADKPIDYLNALAPWDIRNEEEMRNPKSLTSVVLKEIEDRAAEEVIGAFERPSGVAGSLFGDRLAEQYLLLRQVPMWTDSRIQRLRHLVEQANETIADNCRVLLEGIVDSAPQRLSTDPTALRANHELLRLLWSGTSGMPVQARFFKAVAKLRQRASEVLGESLPQPPWWEPVRDLAEGGPTVGVPTEAEPVTP